MGSVSSHNAFVGAASRSCGVQAECSREVAPNCDLVHMLVVALRAAAASTLKRLPLWVSAAVEDRLCGHTPEATRAIHHLRTAMATPFNSANADHEAKLREVWDMLTDNAPYERHTRAWGRLGFQGKDPQTDFRGVGGLGLAVLHHFARHHPASAAAILDHDKEVGGFPLALASISVADALVRLLEAHPATANRVFHHSSGDAAHSTQHIIVLFCEFFAKLFKTFAGFHASAITEFVRAGGLPEMAVMQYNQIHKQYFDDVNRAAASGVVGREWTNDGNSRLAQQISDAVEDSQLMDFAPQWRVASAVC